MVRIRLKRFGRTHHPEYRLCAMDARSPRNGRPIEELGYYHPCNKNEAEQVNLNTERIAYWIGQGAKPSDTAADLLRKAGVELPEKKKRARKQTEADKKAYEEKKAAKAAEEKAKAEAKAKREAEAQAKAKAKAEAEAKAAAEAEAAAAAEAEEAGSEEEAGEEKAD